MDKSKSIDSQMKLMYVMCYLPELKYIALSNWKDYVLKAIHCETGEDAGR